MNTQKNNNSTPNRLSLFSKDPLWLYLLGISGFTFLLADTRRDYFLASLILLSSIVIIYVLYLEKNYFLLHKVERQLRKFGESYSVLTAVELSDGGRHDYSDYIIVSPKGIFNIRILDFEGTISGMENDEYWNLSQIINPYDVIHKSIQNPCDSHRRTQYIIEELLEKNFIKYIPIQSLFVINNSDAIFESNTRIPVVKVKELFNFINEYRDRSSMTSILQEVQSIITKDISVYPTNNLSSHS